MGQQGTKDEKAPPSAAAPPAEKEPWEDLGKPLEGEPDWQKEIAMEYPRRCLMLQTGELDIVTLRFLWLQNDKDLDAVKNLVSGMVPMDVVDEPVGTNNSGGGVSKAVSRKSTNASGASIAAVRTASKTALGVVSPGFARRVFAPSYESEAEMVDTVLTKLEKGCGCDPENEQVQRLAKNLSTRDEIEKFAFNSEDAVTFVKLGLETTGAAGIPADANDAGGAASGSGGHGERDAATRTLELMTAFSQGDLEDYKERFKDDIASGRVKIDELENGQMMRVKLIITSIKAGAVQRRIGEVSSRFPFGATHAALLVGPVVLEWGMESIVIPQKVSDFNHRHAMMCLDVNWALGEHQSHFVSRSQIKDLCKLIEEWNTKKTYSQLRCNCQDFVEACLRQIGMPFASTTASGRNMRDFMDQVSKGMLAQDIKFRFQFGNELKEFKTHADLDQFYDTHKDEILDPADRSLLKAFDRTFWLRYLAMRADDPPYLWLQNAEDEADRAGYTLSEADKEKIKERAARAERDEKSSRYMETGCPHGDPTLNGTLNWAHQAQVPRHVDASGSAQSGAASASRRVG